MVVTDKNWKTTVVKDVVVQCDSNIRKEEKGKLEEDQGLKKNLERVWEVKAKKW